MTLVIDVPPRVPQRGSAFWRFVGRAILRASGWTIGGEIPNEPRMVIAAAPHTSNWDFVIGVGVMFALDLRIAFLGKHTIFVWPFSLFLRWIGGIPVDRGSAHGVVAQSIAAFLRADQLVLAVAPEGTRSHVAHFKTGFLHIAHGAGVPVLLAAFDYENKVLRFGPTMVASDDVEADRTKIEAHFAPVRGKHPRK